MHLNTGNGKTLVGLMLLKSSLNEHAGPAAYLTPDPIYLVDQVEAAAADLDLSTSRDPVPLRAPTLGFSAETDSAASSTSIRRSHEMTPFSALTRSASRSANAARDASSPPRPASGWTGTAPATVVEPAVSSGRLGLFPRQTAGFCLQGLEVMQPWPTSSQRVPQWASRRGDRKPLLLVVRRLLGPEPDNALWQGRYRRPPVVQPGHAAVHGAVDLIRAPRTARRG